MRVVMHVVAQDATQDGDPAPKNAFLYRTRCLHYGKSYDEVVADIRREFDRAIAVISAASVVGEEDSGAVLSGLRVLRRLARLMFEHSDQSEFGGAVNDAIYLNETYTKGSHGNTMRQLRCILRFSLEDFV
jgi:hypothetical protein